MPELISHIGKMIRCRQRYLGSSLLDHVNCYAISTPGANPQEIACAQANASPVSRVLSKSANDSTLLKYCHSSSVSQDSQILAHINDFMSWQLAWRVVPPGLPQRSEGTGSREFRGSIISGCPEPGISSGARANRLRAESFWTRFDS